MTHTDDSLGKGQDHQPRRKSRRPLEIGPPLSLLVIPALFIGAAISLVAWPAISLVRRRQEKSFATRMSAVGRSISWKDLETALDKNQGTIIGECLSEKGPCRLWWTPENVRAVSPHKCYPEGYSRDLYFGPYVDPDFASFFEWCYTTFTSPHSGTGRLISIPKEKRRGKMLNQLIKAMPASSFVATYSPSRLQKQWGEGSSPE